MFTKEMKQIEVALAVVRDSERLLFNLRFSISSCSSARNFETFGLVPYLRATKRNLRERWFVLAIRALWLWTSRKIRSDI